MTKRLLTQLAMILLVLSLIPTAAFAQQRSKKKAGIPTEVEAVEPGIETDPRSFSQIFESNLHESQTKFAESRPTYDMELSYVANTISESMIANDYYQLNFAEQASSPSMVRVYAGFEAVKVNNIFVSPFVGLGYAFQESGIQAISKKGGRYRDVVRLQWAPLSAGAKVGIRLSSLKGTSFFARAAINYDWISITGSLDGITQSYWAPGYNLGVGGNFFEPEHADLNAWFGGVSISGGVTRPLANQGFGSTWIELGLRVLL